MIVSLLMVEGFYLVSLSQIFWFFRKLRRRDMDKSGKRRKFDKNGRIFDEFLFR
jgi:hypothetical protein